MYICPMHPEVVSEKPGVCDKCGMSLEKIKEKKEDHNTGRGMSAWEKFKMSMSMTMGMEHNGISGREMAAMMEKDIKQKFFFSFFLTIPIIVYSPVGQNLLGLNLRLAIPQNWILFILTTPVFFYGGWLFLYSSYQAIKHKTLNMSVLIAVGISAAYFFSVFLTVIGSADSFYEAAAMLITFVLFGHWMEMKSRRGTTDALQALFNLVPPQARLIKNGKEISVPTSEVAVGDILLLKPGDKVPVDGKIIEGDTSIDESLVTGESIPVEKTKGELVIGGSINQSGSVKFEATKVGKDTTLSQIVRLVETAQNSKAPGQKIADRFAKYLVILAIGAGLLTFIIWFFILGQTFLFALTFAISAIVIACPDALGLATPTAVAVGTGIGAKHNILIKDAPTLEQVSKIKAIILDKTGTLTAGKPKITDVVTVGNFDKNDALRFLGAAESKSAHPLASAVGDALKNRGIKLPSKIEEFQNLSGLGVKAKVEGGDILVGTQKLMNQEGIKIPVSLREKIDMFVERGDTIMILSVNKKAVAVIGAADPIKPNSKQTIDKLKSLGLEVVMITGDNEKTTEAISKQLGINRFFANVLPEEKADYVKKLQNENKFVAMVGDGVNDAPALAQADIGIAIGAGTDVAIETAKVVLMKSDPLDILRAIKLSKATVIKMKQNLFWASIYNLLAIPVAAGILFPRFGILLRPEIAALLMSASSIIVATNAVLLNRVDGKLSSI